MYRVTTNLYSTIMNQMCVDGTPRAEIIPFTKSYIHPLRHGHTKVKVMISSHPLANLR